MTKPTITPRENYPFMVWRRSGGRAPRARHATLEDAQAEATRLAVERPGGAYLVLQEILRVQVKDPAGPQERQHVIRPLDVQAREWIERWESLGGSMSVERIQTVNGTVLQKPQSVLIFSNTTLPDDPLVEAMAEAGCEPMLHAAIHKIFLQRTTA